jgi:hypothetical protein
MNYKCSTKSTILQWGLRTEIKLKFPHSALLLNNYACFSEDNIRTNYLYSEHIIASSLTEHIRTEDNGLACSRDQLPSL